MQDLPVDEAYATVDFQRYCSYCPVGIWCQNDVVSTSMRRNHVASTIIRRHFYAMCPLGECHPDAAFPNRSYKKIMKT